MFAQTIAEKETEIVKLMGDVDRLEGLVLRFLSAWNMGEEPDAEAITDARKILFKRGAPANED